MNEKTAGLPISEIDTTEYTRRALGKALDRMRSVMDEKQLETFRTRLAAYAKLRSAPRKMVIKAKRSETTSEKVRA